MMKREKYGRILLFLGIVSFGFAAAEGYYYYAEYREFGFFQFLLMVQNGVKAFVFAADIPAAEALDGVRGSAGTLEKIISYGYTASLLTAPLCTVTALFMTAETLIRRHLGNVGHRNREPVLIFGYNDRVKSLLRNSHGGEEYQLHIFTGEELAEGEELQLLKQGIVLHQTDMAAPADGPDGCLSGAELSRVRRIILLEESSAACFSRYLQLCGSAAKLAPGAKCFCSCEEESVRRIIEDYHDTQIARPGGVLPDLKLFDLAELRVRSMFQKTPLHTCNCRRIAGDGEICAQDWDVHMLVAGFGRLGRQTVLQAMNLGVMHSQSRILIDVMDRDILAKQDIFANRFRPEYVTMTGDEMCIGEGRADGSLRIRFHSLDVRGKCFTDRLREIDRESPLTYAAVCLPEADVSLHCVTELKTFVETGKAEGFPIAVNLETESSLADYLNQNDEGYREVFSIGSDREILSVDAVCEETSETAALEFHVRYERLRIMSQAEAEEKTAENPAGQSGGKTPGEEAQECWRRLAFRKKEASRRLSYHYGVKEAVIRAYLGEGRRTYLLDSFGPEGRILKGCGDRYLYDGSEEEMLARMNENPLALEMAMMEHRRWCYAMAAAGWRYTHGRKSEERKESPYMTDWKTLYERYPYMCIYDLLPVLLMAAEERLDKTTG